MKAALVTRYDAPPAYADVEEPRATGPHDVIVDVLAAGLHPRVLSQADGSHYTSTAELPLVPGIDGVGRDPEGRLRFFVLDDTTQGSMAERTVVDVRRSVVLPDDCDPVAVAAAMNPAMSSWIALRRRIAFHPGQSALVLGATGNAGRMAVQVLRLLGASSVVAAGRDEGRLTELASLGADVRVRLDAPDTRSALGAAAADVDVVVDYVWGEPTAAAMTAVVTDRVDRGRDLTWIEVGSVAGPVAAIPSAALRAARLSIVGSGQGSVSTPDIVAELPPLADVISEGRLTVDARPVPLREVGDVWTDARRTGHRIVVVPGA